MTHSGDGLSGSKLTVPKEYFTLNAKNILIFKVQITRQISSSHSNHQSLTNGNSNGDYDLIMKEENNHQNKKRKTICAEVVKYRGELNMLNNNDCVLKDGEYSLSLTEFSNISSNNLNNINNNLVYGLDKSDNIEDRFKRIVFWESANQVQMNSNHSASRDVTQEPLLTFYLNWTNDLNEIANNQSIKPYLNGKNNQQPLKQIDPPNTEHHNKLSFAKNSKRYQNNALHSNGITNGTTNGSSNGFASDSNVNNCNSTALFNSFLTNGHSNHSLDNLENGNSLSNSKVIYRFIFNKQILQQTRASGDFRCPWCALNCLQIFSLKGHLKFYHSRLNFKFALDNKGYKVDVTVNEAFDGSYCLNPQLDFNNFATNGPQQRTQVTHILTCLKGKIKKKLLSEYLNNETVEFDIFRTQTIGHDRLYYHSKTLQPIKPHEMNEDSEDEIDPEWMRKKTQLMIDDFSDVNEGEKEVMKLWNLHMLKYK